MITIEEQISQLADAVEAQLHRRSEPSPAPPHRSRQWLLRAAALVLVVGGIGAVAAVTVPNNPQPVSNSPGMAPEQVAEERSRLDALLPTASDAQQEALLDGVVTVTEILGLAQLASDCFVAAGGSPIEFDWVGDGLEWTVFLGEDAVEADRLDRIAEQCWSERVGLAEQYIALQNSPSVEEGRRQNQLVIECLRDARIDAPDWPATDVEIDPSIEATCNDQASALLD